MCHDKASIILMYKKGELREQLSSARAAKFAVALIMTKKVAISITKS